MVESFGRNKGVSLKVHEKFFDIFEKERVREQRRIRKQTGRLMNLSQMKFTAILAKRQFQFNFPRLNSKRKIR